MSLRGALLDRPKRFRPPCATRRRYQLRRTKGGQCPPYKAAFAMSATLVTCTGSAVCASLPTDDSGRGWPCPASGPLPSMKPGLVKRGGGFLVKDGVNLLFGFTPAACAALGRPIQLCDDAHSHGRATPPAGPGARRRGSQGSGQAVAVTISPNLPRLPGRPADALRKGTRSFFPLPGGISPQG